jgi:hypothetical protein
VQAIGLPGGFATGARALSSVAGRLSGADAGGSNTGNRNDLEKRFGLAAITCGMSETMPRASVRAPAVVTGRLRWLLVGAMAFATLRLTACAIYAGREFDDKFLPTGGFWESNSPTRCLFSSRFSWRTLQVNYHQYAVSYYFDAATFAIYAVGCLQLPASELLMAPAANVMMVRMAEELREGVEKTFSRCGKTRPGSSCWS